MRELQQVNIDGLGYSIMIAGLLIALAILASGYSLIAGRAEPANEAQVRAIEKLET